MPSSYSRPRSPHRWLKFKGPGGRLVQIAAHGIGPDDKTAGDALATRLEEASQIADAVGSEHAVAELLHWRVITEDEATALRLHQPLPVRAAATKAEPLTIEAAALAHPSTRHEEKHSPSEYDRHLRELREFIVWSGIRHMPDLTLDHVTGWIEYLQKQGFAPDGIRHRLLWLRRASRVGSGYGYADVLPAKMQLIRRPPAKHIEVIPMPALVRAIVALDAKGEHRAAAALALGGCMGFRCSEIIRARVRDVGTDTISTGYKTPSSQRTLPLPPIVRGWILPALKGRKPDMPLLSPNTPKGEIKTTPFVDYTFSQWLAPRIEAHTGQTLPPKNLRKSFATWAMSRGGDFGLWEAWLGHKSATALPVSQRHYLGPMLTGQLRPLAATLQDELHRLATSPPDD